MARTFGEELTALGLPWATAKRIAEVLDVDSSGNTSIKAQSSTDTVDFSFDSSTWLRFSKVTDGTNNLEITMPADSGSDTKYIYMGAHGGNILLTGNRGAMLELAGNNVTPSSSQGRCQLFSGATSNGKIGLNVQHEDGKVIVQDRATNVLEYKPSTSEFFVYNTTYLKPANSTVTLDISSGTKVSVKEGSNARMGVSTLVGGTVTVSNTSVTASSRILHWRQVAGGTLGHLSIGTITAATSFVINSSSGTDTSQVGWLILEAS